MNYSDIDLILMPWAAERSLHVFTEYKGEPIRSMTIVDDSGDTFQMYVGPNPKDPNYPDSALAVVGVTLSKRGDKKYHAFYRERMKYTFEQSVSLPQVSSALDDAWSTVHEWIMKAGHSRKTQ